MPSTKERIADTALGLFNESGSAQISTNHVASAMGISPGNLYYHYRNKDEIILALFERLERDVTALWEPLSPGASVHTLRRIVHEHNKLFESFGFLSREMLVLVQHNTLLREGYERLRVWLTARLRPVIDPLCDKLGNGHAAACDVLLEQLWFCLSLGPTFAQERLRRGAQLEPAALFFSVLEPHLSAVAQRELMTPAAYGASDARATASS